MPDEREYPPELVKSRVFQNTGHVLAVSLSNDRKAEVLAQSFGARLLLDKTKLFSKLVPAIRECCFGNILNTALPLRSSPLIKANDDVA